MIGPETPGAAIADVSLTFTNAMPMSDLLDNVNFHF